MKVRVTGRFYDSENGMEVRDVGEVIEVTKARYKTLHSYGLVEKITKQAKED